MPRIESDPSDRRAAPRQTPVVPPRFLPRRFPGRDGRTQFTVGPGMFPDGLRSRRVPLEDPVTRSVPVAAAYRRHDVAKLTGTDAPVAGPRCLRCALAIGAAGTVWRHRRDRPGVCARLLGWLRRHRREQQSPPLARVADITLPPTTAEPAEHGAWARSIAGPGTAASCVLVPKRPGHDNPGVVR